MLCSVGRISETKGDLAVAAGDLASGVGKKETIYERKGMWTGRGLVYLCFEFLL